MSIPSEIEHEGANITASPEPPSRPELPPQSVLDRTWEVTTGVDGSAVESNPPARSDLMADRFHTEDSPQARHWTAATVFTIEKHQIFLVTMEHTCLRNHHQLESTILDPNIRPKGN